MKQRTPCLRVPVPLIVKLQKESVDLVLPTIPEDISQEFILASLAIDKEQVNRSVTFNYTRMIIVER